MRRKLNSKSSIYSFLKSSGVLESGTPDEIQIVRKEYWREYKRNWRKQKRKTEKEFAILFKADELLDLNKEAKRHNLSRTKFIKQACLAYMEKSFIVPDNSTVRKISQLLSMTYISIQELLVSNLIEIKNGKVILEKIYSLEREILPVLSNPKSIDSLIFDHIKKSPNAKAKLIEFISSI